MRTFPHFIGSAVLLVTLLAACGESHTSAPPPPTGVDVTTPVTSLRGWSTLVADTALTHAQATSLASWVEVFRQGLDLSRMHSTPEERLRSEQAWWAQARTSVTTLVGITSADVVVHWLVARFGDHTTGGT